jgi:hypothetical protein
MENPEVEARERVKHIILRFFGLRFENLSLRVSRGK